MIVPLFWLNLAGFFKLCEDLFLSTVNKSTWKGNTAGFN